MGKNVGKNVGILNGVNVASSQCGVTLLLVHFSNCRENFIYKSLAQTEQYDTNWERGRG